MQATAADDDKTSNQIKHRLVDKLIIVAIKFMAFYAISKVTITAQNRTLARTI